MAGLPPTFSVQVGGTNCLVRADASFREIAAIAGIQTLPGLLGGRNCVVGPRAGFRDMAATVQPTIAGLPKFAARVGGRNCVVRPRAGFREVAATLQPAIAGVPEFAAPLGGRNCVVRPRAGFREIAATVQPAIVGLPALLAPVGRGNCRGYRVGMREMNVMVQPAIAGVRTVAAPVGGRSYAVRLSRRAERNGAAAMAQAGFVDSSTFVASLGERHCRGFRAGMQHCLGQHAEVGTLCRAMKSVGARRRSGRKFGRSSVELPGHDMMMREGAGFGKDSSKLAMEMSLQGRLRRLEGKRAVVIGIGFGRGALPDNFGTVTSGRRRGRRLCGVRASNADTDSENKWIVQKAAEILHVAVSLGAFLALDKFLKDWFLEAGIRFPSALFGMFCIFALLNVADAIKPEAAAAIISTFQPAISFIQRWLPLFYVPSLVVVPLAIKGIPTAAAAKIALIFVGGWAASLAVAGYTAMAVRNVVKTEMMPAEYTPKPTPFADWELTALGLAAVLSFALAVYSPSAMGSKAVTASPFFLSVTALGYVFGSNIPADLKKVFHPIISCAITANLAAFAYGLVTKIGYEGALKTYLTKQAEYLGAGDILMGVLGSVILSFAFSMFNQRKLVKRHAAEIFSAVAAAGMFSLYSTAAAGRLLGLPSGLTLAIVPRCITVALALPIAGLLEATNPSLTAAIVVLTGLIGANFTQLLMDKLGFGDPISRGLATASSAHGLGTAALSAKEPEALPFCAIAYALTGIFCSLLVSVPAIQRSLVVLAGAV